MALETELPGLASADEAIYSALAAAMTPPPEMTVSEWAQAKRWVAGGSMRGPWRNENAPYLVEIMDCLTPSHPCRRVAAKIAAQMGKSSGLCLNWVGYSADYHPGPILYVLPSADQVRSWNREDWLPNYHAVPEGMPNVFGQCFHEPNKGGGGGQTEDFKPFRGGQMMITGATSSKGLQRRNVRDLICDEISEFVPDADNRGDPVEQARSRQDQWGEDAKELDISTPKDLPACRITKYYLEGDQRQFYVACPHCGSWQTLLLANLKGWDGVRYVEPTESKARVREAVFRCGACAQPITQVHKARIVRAGVYIKTYPGTDENPAPPPVFPPDQLARWRARPSEGREPSFHCWQAYSLFKPWLDLLNEYRVAHEGGPATLKTFMQQKAAEAWDAAGEAPDHEKLYQRRESRPDRVIPEGAWIVTAFIDVQGDRLEFFVWAFGPGFTSYRIDHQIFEGDPNKPDVWKRAAEARGLKYHGANGHIFAIDAMGVDSGYLTSKVYSFCRGRHMTLALDGRAGAGLPPLGGPRAVKNPRKRTSGVIYPVGTHDLKLRLYHGLSLTAAGPDKETGEWPLGAVRLDGATTDEFCRQLTAEALVSRQTRSGALKWEWVKIAQRANEALDGWVGCAALAASAIGIDNWGRDQWAQIMAARGGVSMTEMERLMAGLPDAGAGRARARGVRRMN